MDFKNSSVIEASRLILMFVAILALPGLTKAVPADPDCPHEYHWLEAECGDITAPGQLGEDPEASGHGYLATPAGSGRFIEQATGPLIASYDYTLAYDCHDFYYLWARVKYDAYQYNSFWVAFDHSTDFPWRFPDQLTGQWHWQRLGSISGLWRGDHTLFLKLREEQTQVDKFLMTSDASFTPEGVGEAAENSCFEPTPGSDADCDLCDPQINLGDLVVLRDPYFPDDLLDGWPAIVVGKEAGHFALLTHAELPHMPPYAKAHAPQGQGFPYDWLRYPVAVSSPDPFQHTIIVPAHSFEQYIDCRGLLSFHWDAQRLAYTGAFRSDEGWSGDIDIMPGVMPDGISAGDNPNMRLQGMLHRSENTVRYPLVSSTLRPLAREGDVVIREIFNDRLPAANTYGLGVIECWNLDRPGESKIISLTDLLAVYSDQLIIMQPSDSEMLTCMTVHLRPSPFDFALTGSFISYVCSDCGVIRRIDQQQPRFENGTMSDSDFALVFDEDQACYVLPRGIHFGSWSDLEGQPYRLAGFQAYMGPAGTAFGQVSIGGVSHQRIGFLAAPVAALPCGDGPVEVFTLEVTAGDGGHVTPGAGSFIFDPGESVTLTAVPDSGYSFDGWTTAGIPAGVINPASATVTFTMNGDYSFHAKFKRTIPPTTYKLKVSSDKGGHVAPSEGNERHPAGTVLTLTAVPDSGYAFDGWTTKGVPAGTVDPTSATVSFALNGNYTFRANFKKIPAPVTYTLRVSSDRGGHVTPAEGTSKHNAGTVITLTAVPDSGYAFDGWTIQGVPAGTVNPASAMVSFALNGNYTFHAKFKRVIASTKYTLAVFSGAGGHVAPAEGDSRLPAGTMITLTAVPDSGYAFDGWTTQGVPAGTIDPSRATVTFALNGNYLFQAKFRPVIPPTTFILEVFSDTGGHVAPTEGDSRHPAGTVITLTAVPDSGYAFDGWTTQGVPAGTIDPSRAMVSFALNGNYLFHAKFRPTAPPTQYGLTVSSDAGGKVVPAEGTFTFNPGTWAVLVAIADPGYAFAGWTTTGVPAGTIDPADEVVFFPVNGNYSFHARFTPVAQNLPNLTDGGLLYRDIHPQVVYRGDTVNVSFRLRNTGTANAADSNGLIRIAYFASTDATITSTDYPLGDEFTWSLPATQFRDITVPLSVPNSLPRGSYYVGWIIDPHDGIPESNENDNLAFKQSKKLTVQ